MENNKLLFAIFTICIVILVLLVVQMCILVPMAMHSGHNHMHHYPMMSSAPAFSGHHCCPPRFWCHPHKMMPPKPGFLKDKPKPGVPPKVPAEPQAVPEVSK